jgi:DegV family protein with EDD domain
MFGGQTYIDGETLTATQAYEFIQKDPDGFQTSAMMPAQLLEPYREASAAAEEVVFVTLSSALSAAFKTAQMAAETFREESPKTRVHVWDSRAVAGTQGLTVLTAARSAAGGMGAEDVIAVAEKVRGQSRGLMLLDTLRYVYRTGRMSKLSSRLLSVLNIKPVNRLTQEGTIEPVERARKRTEGLDKLLNLIRRDAQTDSLHFMLSHAAAPEMTEGFTDMLQRNFNCLSMVVSDYSPVMGYGAGPGSLFVGFHPEVGLSG